MFKFLLHVWRLTFEPSGKERLLCFGNPKWQVIYNDGNKSIPMHYDVACDYADMFGGKVVKYQRSE